MTSTGAILALFVAISTVGSNELPRPLPCIVQVALLVSLSGAVGAAVSGLVANLPRGYEEAAVKTLKRIAESEFWEAPSSEIASRRAAELRIDVIEAARSINDGKARAVAVAIGCQVIAIAALASAIAALLLSQVAAS